MAAPLPPYISRDEVHERLQHIFPTSAPGAGWVTRDIGSATVFVALYIGAVDNRQQKMAPKHVYRMTDEQAAEKSDAQRLDYAREVMKRGYQSPGPKPWYADTSREPIRDETIRQGLMPVRAAIEDESLAKTSSRPRYALTHKFAALFDPALTGSELEEAIEAWQQRHFDRGNLTRIRLLRAGVAASEDAVVVSFPNNGGTRTLSSGKSSVITKAVIEEFAVRFLERPAVIWVSESGRKVVTRDDQLAKSVGLEIDQTRVLPDIILIDLRGNDADPPILVFAEVVATDGPVNDLRKRELLELAEGSAFSEDRIAFLTAFEDRNQTPSRLVSSLAWGTFAWYASEPDGIVGFHRTTTRSVTLPQLMAGS